MPINLYERLTFDQLFRYSEPKRVQRSLTVKGPPLEIDSYQDAVYYCFNFKSNPSTTGLRHRGYIKFFKPKHKNPSEVPLQHLDCLVDCDCADNRYRWAWVNKQHGSGAVGPNSLNQAWNKAPRKTNPLGKIGLCKHLLAARSYIYGLMSAFPNAGKPDTAEKLNKLTKFAQKRWTDIDAEMDAARARERQIAKARAMRNLGGSIPEPKEPEQPDNQNEPLSTDARTAEPEERKEKETEKFQAARPPKLPVLPKRPQRAAAPVRATTAPIKKSAQKQAEPAPEPKPYGGYNSKAEYDFYRRQGLGDSLIRKSKSFIAEHVVSSENFKYMSDLKDAIKLVEELEDDALKNPPMGPVGDGSEGLEPSEPPVSDSAVGADTEGKAVLDVLAQIKELLQQLVAKDAPEEPVEEPEGTEGEEAATEGEGEMPDDDVLPPEAPTDEVEPDEAEMAEAERLLKRSK